MSEATMDVLVAGYPDIDAAQHDFDAITELVKDKQVKVEGVILVRHDADGQVTVVSTGDHLGRKGLGSGTGVGLVVGLFAPGLLASVAVGAAGGAIVGRFADHKLKSGIHDKIGENLPAGSAGIIAVFPSEHRLAIEQALPGSPMKSIVESDEKGLKQLQASLAEAMGKFSPDRTKLPIPDRNFGGTIGRTIDKSVADWSIVPGPKAPEGAPNVLIVLIDDAGFGNPSTFGGQVETPTMTRVQQKGLTYNRFHVTAVCSPTRAALLTGRNHHRVASAPSPNIPVRSRAIPPPSPAAARAFPGSCGTTGTSPAVLASGI
jgi:uncharacterized membrane protein